ncbi:Replicase polyprotein 1ab [Symbioplanes lichenis]|uniref:Replicase polyprotein 1ab n=1 Tax=Symbioplanes lichenis TaxID=1629072 RepID=UPI00273893DF|nr:Replicase polyprotein 1ab [Actinoplanes lichenis]
MAAGQIIDEDSELALRHAIAARRLASRIAVVREAVGLAAYAAGDWTTAIAELRTYHRMTGRQTHLAELADCERALGRPERAIDLYRGADKDALDQAGSIELLIVAAGARGDLGQHDAAVAMLQIKELTADADADWAARLRYAYADALLAAGRRDEAREWFSRAAAADEDDLTDAAERLLELDGVTIEGDDEDEDDETRDGEGEARDRDGEQAREGDDDRDDEDDDLEADEDADRDDDYEDEDDDRPEARADSRDEDFDDEDELDDEADEDVDAGIDSDEDERDDVKRGGDEFTTPAGPDADEESAEPVKPAEPESKAAEGKTTGEQGKGDNA